MSTLVTLSLWPLKCLSKVGSGWRTRDRHIETVGTSLFYIQNELHIFYNFLKNSNFSVHIFAITLVFPVKCSSIGLNPKDGVSLVYKELYTSH